MLSVRVKFLCDNSKLTGSKMLCCYADAKRLAWRFGPIEKSHVKHAAFIDLALCQYLSYLVEIKFILVESFE